MDASSIGMGWLLGGTLGGIVIGALTTCWAKVKSLFWYLLSYFFTTVELKDQQTAHAVLGYLLTKYKRSKYANTVYGSQYESMRDGKYGMVPFEFLGGKNLIFWRGWMPLFYGISVPAPKVATQSSPYAYNPSPDPSKDQKITLFFLRGTFNVEKIVAEAIKTRNSFSWDVSEKNKVKRFFIKPVPCHTKEGAGRSAYSSGTGLAWYQEPVHRLITYKVEDLGRCHPGKKKALDLLVYPQRVKDLIKEIVIWRRNRDWYIERGIPWKRGWLLYGPPGTGKTALVRAFAEDLDLPLFTFSLGEMMNTDLYKSWEELQAHTPCIALFEDLDNVFHGRKNIYNEGSEADVLANVFLNREKKEEGAQPDDKDKKSTPKFGRLNFDCLLNCLDGVNKADGIFVVITTNYIEKIDEAIGKPRELPDGSMEFISTRPGRIDKAIELTYMLKQDKYELAQRILYDCPDGMEQIAKFIEKYPDLKETPAQFQERCAQLALAYFWKSQVQDDDKLGQAASEQMSKQALFVHKEAA
jgi:DNA polymerase III delta prime subunit